MMTMKDLIKAKENNPKDEEECQNLSNFGS